ncbi:HEPN domain protein [Ferroglobus placidus DSM 10642]|uniref:HEPN domain protein n=1 Tax=Ferroglobus placidus (strain DSM 10642 / AEDII12DO) TaxID=589924 RepID=D3RXK9_FERPA|nr:HEPN domain-containing protein [Ferroglobus placidus]ADC65222.1 HEPN domain protein [Ferroglobus placidus DSM 10642]
MEEFELHLQRAKKSFEAFKILKDKGLYEDAISRGYYAILHLCYALLIKNGLDLPKTHSGLVAKLWQNREMLGINEEIVKSISRIQSLRENGDYGVISALKEEDLALVEEIYKKLLGAVER